MAFGRRVTIGAVTAGLVVALAVPVATGQDTPEVVRREGDDRFETAVAVSEAAFPEGAPVVFVATGLDFPDALTAGALAGQLGGPVLLTSPDVLSAATRDEIQRLQPDGAIVVGGSGVIPQDVVDEIDALVGDDGATRVAGSSRFHTAEALSLRFVDPEPPVVYVASGVDHPDALVAGPAAATDGGPILLVRTESIPDATRRELERLDPARIVVTGGPAAVSESVRSDLAELTSGPVQRRFGDDRYGTAAAVSSATFPAGAEEVYLATGADFPDALAGAASAGHAGVPLLTTRPDCVPDVVLDELNRLDPPRIVVLGGERAVGAEAAALTPCSSQPDPGPPVTTEIQTGLDAPWDVTFTPDGRTFLTERDSGRLLERFADGGITEVATFSVDNDGEGGLLGLTHSPDWAQDGWLYVFFTTPSDQRIVRVRPSTGEQDVILDGIPDATFHDAGRIIFGPDGMLYAAVGDAGVPQRAQDLGSLAGKILRMEPDGSVPSDNPYPDSLVWAYGLRDPQGLAFDASGRLYATEFGPDRDDEINQIVPGGNYAWGSDPGGQASQPTGVTGNPDWIDPIVVRQPPEASWSGAAILDDSAIPGWDGDLFAAALRGSRLYRIDLDPQTGGVVGVETVLDGYGRLRHVAQAPDGSLWVLTNNCDGRGTCPPDGDRILRIAPETS